MKKKVRPFGKDDWNGFSGAECEPDKPPCIRDKADNWFGVMDVLGIEIYTTFSNQEVDEKTFRYDCNYKDAKVILELLPDTITPELLKELGFMEV